MRKELVFEQAHVFREHREHATHEKFRDEFWRMSRFFKVRRQSRERRRHFFRDLFRFPGWIERIGIEPYRAQQLCVRREVCERNPLFLGNREWLITGRAIETCMKVKTSRDVTNNHVRRRRRDVERIAYSLRTSLLHFVFPPQGRRRLGRQCG